MSSSGMKTFLTVLLSFIGIAAIGLGISFIWGSGASTVNFLKQYWLWILGAISFLLIGVLWKLPKLQVNPSIFTDPKDRFTLENEARKTIAHILGGIVILIGLYFTWQTVQSTRKTVELNQESIKSTYELTRKNLELTQEGQVTERFTRAIDQLGKKDSLELRLGGIYTLERMARVPERDHWQIMEILTAYVRENAHLQSKVDMSNQNKPINQNQIQKPKADIQAILTILGRRMQTYGNGENQRLDLSEVDIRGANLVGANFQEADLTGANLQGANLSSANLQGANLVDANLQEADLVGARLQEAVLGSTNLQGAFLGGAKLQKADLSGANLQKSALDEANLQEANLLGANLQRAFLGSANLQNAKNLTIEQLSKVKTLYGAKLDSSLMEQIQRDYPHLLDKPK